MTIVVFAGQSNTGGYGMSEATLAQPWTADPNILIWNTTSHRWESMQPGVNTGYGQFSTAWGPEVQFALDFRAAHPGEALRIVKVAHGGTGLDRDDGQWVGDWSPESRDELFDEVTRIVAEARGAAGGERVEAVFFGQGEEDAAYAGKAQDYAANLPALFSAIRAQWMENPNGHISFFRINTAAPYAEQVRTAQATVDAADDYALSFDTESFGRQGDLLHFSGDGHRSIGHGYFEAFQAWRSSASSVGQEINGAGGPDVLIGGAGDDSINGGGGEDFMRGGEGHDRMAGGDDFDDMHGNQGNDTLAGGGGGDWVVGGKDDDHLYGDDGGDVVLGNLGNDLVDGGAGGDVLRGGQGDDLIYGWSGDDWISGDRGSDTLSGGSGADIFHTFGEAGRDMVTDFNFAEGDRVYLLPGTHYAVSQVGADVVVSTEGGGELVLQNVQLASLGAGWIIGA